MMGVEMKVYSLHGLVVWLGIFASLMLTSCSSKVPINFNIHTEPEGAYIVYSLDKLQWIHLGVTPLEAVEVIDEERLEGDNTLTLRAMRCGYLEQSKDWSGKNLLKENEEKSMIFWTPRLVKDAE
jgi:hypothetical protein